MENQVKNTGAEASLKASQSAADDAKEEQTPQKQDVESGVPEKAKPSDTTSPYIKRPPLKPATRRTTSKAQGIDEQQLSAELKQLSLNEQKKRLSGAGRRRYAYHRNHGKNIKEAYELACLPMLDTLSIVQAGKRVRPLSKTPPSEKFENKRQKTKTLIGTGSPEKHNAYKKPEAEAQPPKPGPSYGDAVKGIRIGVIHAEHPQKNLTAEQLAACQKSILAAIPIAAKEGINPQFGGLSLKPGWMLITCLNETTSKWLEQMAAKISMEESTHIRAVREENIPKLEIITGYFPNEEDETEEIKILIESQNPDLSAMTWKTLGRRLEGTCAVITFSIDGQSMENLKQRGFRICYKFGGITFRPKSKEANSGQPPISKDVPKETE